MNDAIADVLTKEANNLILEGAERLFFEVMTNGEIDNCVRRGNNFASWTCPVPAEYSDYSISGHSKVTPCGYLARTITISFQGEVIWWMTNSEKYPAKVVTFLREVLTHTFQSKEFHGGRGPFKARCGSWEYNNHPYGTGFQEFYGRETITNGGVEIGHGDYSGGSLMD